MTSAESTNYAKRYLQKAVEYLASAQDNLDLERATPAAGDAIQKLRGDAALSALLPNVVESLPAIEEVLAKKAEGPLTRRIVTSHSAGTNRSTLPFTGAPLAALTRSLD